MLTPHPPTPEPSPGPPGAPMRESGVTGGNAASRAVQLLHVDERAWRQRHRLGIFENRVDHPIINFAEQARFPVRFRAIPKTRQSRLRSVR
jgi:hypothetical protein